MVIFPLAPDQTIAQMWSNGARVLVLTVLEFCQLLTMFKNIVRMITTLCVLKQCRILFTYLHSAMTGPSETLLP